METRLLKMFCAVADCGSLVKAAAKLHLTPSAVSHGLKDLETDLDCRLFERAGKKLLLNHAGEQLLAQVGPALVALETATDGIKRFARQGKTRLRIGAAPTACAYVLPRVIRELKKLDPRMELQIDSGNTSELIELIRGNKLDLALGISPENHVGLEITPVFKDELMFTFAPEHPWADGRPITRDELRFQPIILTHKSSLTAKLIHRHFQNTGVNPSVMEIASVEAIKELVKLNLGVSVLAPWTAEKELLRGTLLMRPPAPKPIWRSWVVLSLLGREFSPLDTAFCRLCRSYATGIRLDRRDIPDLL
ncbi:MAG: LysR family transcriptional regulator [Verrucomicrobiota bacterium]